VRVARAAKAVRAPKDLTRSCASSGTTLGNFKVFLAYKYQNAIYMQKIELYYCHEG
jgi:hypothetical protein